MIWDATKKIRGSGYGRRIPRLPLLFRAFSLQLLKESISQGALDETVSKIKALKIYENILVVAPDDVQTLILAGHINVSMNRFEAAKEKYQRVLAVEPTQFAVHYDVLLASLIGAPLLAMAAAYLPTLVALRQDPAVALREM